MAPPNSCVVVLVSASRVYPTQESLLSRFIEDVVSQEPLPLFGELNTWNRCGFFSAVEDMKAHGRQGVRSIMTPPASCPIVVYCYPLTPVQENLVSRFLEDVDGFDGNGEPVGEPAGVWAEIGPFGGLGASEAAAR